MNTHFALVLNDLHPDQDVNSIFVTVLVLLFLLAVGITIWHFAPILSSAHKGKRAEKIKSDNNIWFDAQESVLYRGVKQLKIPENTIEFYVCKTIFAERGQYQSDLNVLENYGGDTLKQRPVYFAVIRLNKKVKSELKLSEDLFIRGKEKTALNRTYR